MSKPAAFSACYSDWKLIKTRACVQICFEVPIEKANEAYAALGGMPVHANETWFAIARLKQQQEEPTTATEKPAPSNPAARVPRSPLVTRAAMLSNDPLFWKYLGEKEGKLIGKDGAANHIREWCKVESRKDIQPGTEAALRLDLLQTDFVCWRDKDAYVEAAP